MRKFRTSIGFLMITILLIGLAFAAITNPTEWRSSAIYTMTISLLLFSLIGLLVRRDSKRLFWLGFAIYGWFFFIQARQSEELYRPVTLATLTAELLNQSYDIAPTKSRRAYLKEPYEHFKNSMQCGLILLAGLAGGISVQLFAQKKAVLPPHS